MTGNSLLVEIQTPEGETVRRAFARAGSVVRFKKLMPAIYLACLSDRSERRGCQSVDLYPPPGDRAAEFSVELKPRASAPQPQRFCMVGTADLAVPEMARREFGEFMKDRRRGDMAAALGHLERALAIAPEYPEAMINLGFTCHLAGDYARAIQLFEQVTHIAPEMYAAWLNLGVALLLSGDPRRALQAELRALSLHPDDPFVVYQAGVCHYCLGQLDEAKQNLRRVIELDPSSATFPHLLLARIALREGQKDKASRLVRELSTLHPHAPRLPGMVSFMSQRTAAGFMP
jgi:predicted Zn-dependent protease